MNHSFSAPGHSFGSAIRLSLCSSLIVLLATFLFWGSSAAPELNPAAAASDAAKNIRNLPNLDVPRKSQPIGSNARTHFPHPLERSGTNRSVGGGVILNPSLLWLDHFTSSLQFESLLSQGLIRSLNHAPEPLLFQAGSVNVALPSNGGVASASSTFSTAYPASAANNGDRKGIIWGNGGGWADANNGVFPDWLQINFSGSKTINEIDLFTVQAARSNPIEPTETMPFTYFGITAFHVQYWNGASWLDVPGGNVTGNNKVWRKFTFPNITTGSIRVVV